MIILFWVKYFQLLLNDKQVNTRVLHMYHYHTV